MRIGLCSTAHLHVDAYVDNLRAAKAVVVGVADDDTQRGRRWGLRHDVPWFPTHESLLEAGVDGVIVCAETARHRRVVELAAQAGVAVLCEKPLATTAEDARAIVEACEAAGVPLMTAFPMRFSPPMQQARALLTRGTIGTLHAAVGTNQGALPMRHRSWFVDPALSGGGALMDHVVHLVDVLRWYLGEEVAEVYCRTNRLLHADAVTVETGGLLLLTMDSGLFASIDCSWSKPDTYPTWGGLTLEVVGSEGVLGIDPFAQRLTVHGGPEGPLAWPQWGSDANQGLIDEFLDVIAQRRPPAVTGHDGLAATCVALAGYTSMATGQPVTMAAAAVTGSPQHYSAKGPPP
ncbi:MAG TPA: Gfo/Idh/MocA family oxidoreductase, partial [Euzebya sp.]|nr:Gfo/Idh/MocA family oxidoreductase [Euzebya sp.]